MPRQETSSRALRRGALLTSMLQLGQLASHSQSGTHSLPTLAHDIFTPSRGRCRSIRGVLRFLRLSITVSPFARVATSTFLWLRDISITMLDGRNCWSKSSQATPPVALLD